MTRKQFLGRLRDEKVAVDAKIREVKAALAGMTFKANAAKRPMHPGLFRSLKEEYNTLVERSHALNEKIHELSREEMLVAQRSRDRFFREAAYQLLPPSLYERVDELAAAMFADSEFGGVKA